MRDRDKHDHLRDRCQASTSNQYDATGCSLLPSLPDFRPASRSSERFLSRPSGQAWPEYIARRTIDNDTLLRPSQELSDRPSLNAGSTKPLSVSSLLSPIEPGPAGSRMVSSNNHSRANSGQARAYGPSLASEQYPQPPTRTSVVHYAEYRHEPPQPRPSIDTYESSRDLKPARCPPPSQYARSGKSNRGGSLTAGGDYDFRIAPMGTGLPFPFIQPPPLNYTMKIRQQPFAARACGYGDRDRRVIDPPPIVELQIKCKATGASAEDLSGGFALHCALMDEKGTADESELHSEDTYPARRLTGTLIASPNDVQDEHGIFGRFFMFHDLSCRTVGRYRLLFRLIRIDTAKMRPGTRFPMVATVLTEIFTVYPAKDFPGMKASSNLLKALRAQGVVVGVKKGIEFSHAGRWKRKVRDAMSDQDSRDDDEDEADRYGSQSDGQIASSLVSGSGRRGRSKISESDSGKGRNKN